MTDLLIYVAIGAIVLIFVWLVVREMKPPAPMDKIIVAVFAVAIAIIGTGLLLRT